MFTVAPNARRRSALITSLSLRVSERTRRSSSRCGSADASPRPLDRRGGGDGKANSIRSFASGVAVRASPTPPTSEATRLAVGDEQPSSAATDAASGRSRRAALNQAPAGSFVACSAVRVLHRNGSRHSRHRRRRGVPLMSLESHRGHRSPSGQRNASKQSAASPTAPTYRQNRLVLQMRGALLGLKGPVLEARLTRQVLNDQDLSSASPVVEGGVSGASDPKPRNQHTGSHRCPARGHSGPRRSPRGRLGG